MVHVPHIRAVAVITSVLLAALAGPPLAQSQVTSLVADIDTTPRSSRRATW